MSTTHTHACSRHVSPDRENEKLPNGWEVDWAKKPNVNAILLVTLSNEVVDFKCLKELHVDDENFCETWEKLLQATEAISFADFHIMDGYLFKGNQLCTPHMSL